MKCRREMGEEGSHSLPSPEGKKEHPAVGAAP